MPLSVSPTPPTLVAPKLLTVPAAAVWTAVNRAVFMRFDLPAGGTYRYINWISSVQSGNVQVGVVSLSGANRTTYARVMDSTVIACPAAANIRTDLGATYLPAGDYAMFMWADNTTFQTRSGTSISLDTTRVAGTASSLASGVGTSGTLSWSSNYAHMVLEGDV